MTAIDYLGLDGVSDRYGTVRWVLLDLDGNVEGELHPDADKDRPRMRNDSSSAIKRSCSGVVLPQSEWEDVNIGAARVRPEFIIDGDPHSPYPLGVFLFGDDSHKIGTGYQDLHADLDDQGVIIDQGIRGTFSANQGEPVEAVMRRLIALYPVTFDIVGTSATLPTPNAWPRGTLGSRILSDLCDAAGYLPAYFDNSGVGHLRPAGPFDSLVPRFLYGPGTIIIADTPVETDQILSAPNVFDVTGNGGADNAIFGEYVLPASAPNSIAVRGFAIVSSQSLASVGDSSQARAAAEAAATNPDSGFRQWQFSTTPNPLHDTFDLIGKTDSGEVYRELSWTLDLVEGGEQTHTATRLDGVTFDE